MTWGEFKKLVDEFEGVTDETEVLFIDTYPDVDTKVAINEHGNLEVW